MAYKTIVRIPSTGETFTIQNVDLTESQIRTSYAADLPSIGNMVDTVTTETDANGEARVHTFTPRVGNKGTQ